MANKRIYLDGWGLYEDHWRRGLDIERIARERGVSTHAVVCWMNRHGVPIRGASAVRARTRRRTRHPGTGYVSHYVPDHPYTQTSGYVLEHRLVMEKKIGGYLDPSEVVHHIDQDVSNNSVENLILFESIAEHTKHHLELNRTTALKPYSIHEWDKMQYQFE